MTVNEARRAYKAALKKMEREDMEHEAACEGLEALETLREALELGVISQAEYARIVWG